MEAIMNKISATINVDAFVIPNRHGKLNLDLSYGRRYAEMFERISKINHFPFDKEKDQLVELWFVGKNDFEASEDGTWLSNNLQAHGFTLQCDNGYRYHFSSGKVLGFLPNTALINCKEGDTISLVYPIKPSMGCDIPVKDLENIPKDEWDNHLVRFDNIDGTDTSPEIMITMNITFNQRDYRYRSFGNFEDVVEMVTTR